MEKSFLSLLLISFLLHVAGFFLIQHWPREKKQLPEPAFIEMKDVTELKPSEPVKKPKVAPPSDRKKRVARESSPKSQPRITPVPPPMPAARPVRPPPTETATPATGGQGAKPFPSATDSRPLTPGSSASELIRRKPAESRGESTGTGGGIQPRLMPSATRMARIEDDYRRRYADDVDQGSTRFLNTDDIQFRSFLNRFETAVYGVWRYPYEAAIKGVEGVTPVRITFNRSGEIVKVKMLESSGSKILDDEVLRTLRLIGPLGSFPRNYTRDEFHLIAFFHYGNSRGRLR